MFVLTCIYRTASSGFEHNNKHIFDTIEKASEYIRTEWYDGLCELNEYPSEWNEEHLGGPMPSRDDFTVEAIKKKGRVLFAPYDRYHAIVQNELHLDKVDRK
jgi:hypothetical protein